MNLHILKRGFNMDASFWFKFHVMDREGAKQNQSGLRSWLAWAFRGIADRIDGASSMSVDLNSTPALSEQDKIMVINRGLTHSRNLFVELVQNEAVERGMRESLPGLYREDSCKTKS